MSEIKKIANNENVIFYNNDLEQLLAQSAEECESLGILHLASYEKYNKLSNIINIPVIILSSGIGFITGIDLNYDKMNIILGIGSVFVGIIKSIDSYFQLGKRAESHRMCALQYTQINKKIQIELSLCREQRQTAKDMLSIIKTDIKNLQDISPVIDQEIIKEYNLKYGKYKNVKKPNFVNGLTVVKVNSNSLEQELAAARSIPQSVQSGAPSRALSVAGDNENKQQRYVGMGMGHNINDFSHFNGNNDDNTYGKGYIESGIENLNDVAINIPFHSLQNESIIKSKPNSRIHSPELKTQFSLVQQLPNHASTIPSASAQLVFKNANSNTVSPLQTPVSSSPVSNFRLQDNNGSFTRAASSRLSTPQLLESFNRQEPPHEEHHNLRISSDNRNDVNLIIDIPDTNENDNGNNNNENLNPILNYSNNPGSDSSPRLM